MFEWSPRKIWVKHEILSITVPLRKMVHEILSITVPLCKNGTKNLSFMVPLCKNGTWGLCVSVYIIFTKQVHTYIH